MLVIITAEIILCVLPVGLAMSADADRFSDWRNAQLCFSLCVNKIIKIGVSSYKNYFLTSPLTIIPYGVDPKIHTAQIKHRVQRNFTKRNAQENAKIRHFFGTLTKNRSSILKVVRSARDLDQTLHPVVTSLSVRKT